MEIFIPVLSLLVAALAVFVGPIISISIAKRHIRAFLKATRWQVIAPMRQAWINNLRDVLAELSSRSVHYYCAGYEDRTEKEYYHITFLEHRIRLMLNPNEEEHKQLENLIRKMISSLESGKAIDKFSDFHTQFENLSKMILKREWNVIKEGNDIAMKHINTD